MARRTRQACNRHPSNPNSLEHLVIPPSPLMTAPPSSSGTQEYTWFGTSSSDPLYDKLGWNQWDATIRGLPRSSNLAEGRHNGFKSIVNCTNPTIWNFMDALQLEHSLTELKIVKHLTRTPPPPRQKKWINYDNRLQRVVGSYDRYPILTYLKVIGSLI